MDRWEIMIFVSVVAVLIPRISWTLEKQPDVIYYNKAPYAQIAS